MASYFIALVAIYSCFKSTNLATTAGENIETAEPKPWHISRLVGFIIISSIAYFGYYKFVIEEIEMN